MDDLETFLNTTKIGDDNIQTNGITASDKLIDASISTAKLASSAVTAAKLASDAVTTAKILDANVTAAKLAFDAVTTAKILDANVTTAKIADSAVTTAKIADGAITAGKFSFVPELTRVDVTTTWVVPAGVDNIVVLGIGGGGGGGGGGQNGAGQHTCGGSGGAGRAAFLDARIAALHAGLELTPAQEKLWLPVDSALRDTHKVIATQRAARRDGPRPADPVAWLQRVSDNALARGEALKKLADAAAPLYAALNDDQKHRLPFLLHAARFHVFGERFAANDGWHGHEGLGWRGDHDGDHGGDFSHSQYDNDQPAPDDNDR